MGGQSKSKKSNKSTRKQNNRGQGLSGQERMKLKMQEKAKKKTAEKYSVEQLLEKTEEYMDNFDFEMAQLFCQRALDLEPTNLNVLDMLGNICAELGNEEKAKQVFLRAVELSPDEGHSKYMYLGQIHSGVEAVQYFSKGVEAMLNALEKQTPAAAAAAISLDDPEVTNKDVSVAFCSIAEIFFTDLCMDDGAAEKCKEAIDKALQYDPDNPEALQLMASYLFSIEKTQEGKEFLMRSLAAWLPSLQKKTDQTAREKQDDGVQDGESLENMFPPYESRITTTKLLIEAEEYELATEILESLLEEDDEVVQVWYLFGWVCYLQVEKPEETEAFKDSARTYLTKAKKLYMKVKCDDTPMLEHMEQLLAELGPGEDLLDSEEDLPAENIDDDFVESSDNEAMEQ
ncbi:probable assembly chaperone of rpl4 isoform X1 [Polyodon spathula]|uniref:probable assembly chaperone of rpl4 isoform X1 n=1 Tax=Polyodon spathula TaxID=7913 RepID=UPI001B7E97FA|nr:probable assembly chaperone of rpl4 isoform X1 [Polyodon spathula]